MPPIDGDEQGFSADDLALLNGMPDGESEAGGDPAGQSDAPDGEGKASGKDAPATDAKAASGEKPTTKADSEAADGKKATGEGDDTSKPSWPSDGFPDDWRERTIKMLGLEGDALKRASEAAKRSASPAELLRRVMAADAKIGEATAALKERVKLPTVKGAKDEDVAAFRSAWGVPEAPDKYDLAAVGEMTPLDKEIWGEVLPKFHASHFSQAQIAEVGAALKTAESLAARRMEERATKLDGEMRDALLVEYGSGKAADANIELANRYLGELLGEHMPDGGQRAAFLNMKFADGTRLGSYTPFVKAIISAARNWAPDGLPDIGEGGDAVDPQKRINEISVLAHSGKDADRREYERLQPELDRLIAQQLRRNAAAKG